MYKRNKKGFSLIELLAVVIILAILALITIPIVGNLIKQARINAAVVSAYGYVEATNNEVVSKQTKGETVLSTQYEIEDYNIVGNYMNIKYEGKGPEKGWFILEKEKVKNGEFCINGYEVHYNNGVATYAPDGEYCAPPPRPTICRITDGLLDYTETTEFEVAKIEDLVCLTDLVKNGYTFQSKTIKLTANLDFNDDNSYNDPNGILDNHTVATKQEVTTGSGFYPIGNDSTQFKGIFDGNDLTIKNLMINRNQRYLGFFGYINGSTIKNLNLEGFNIKNSYSSSNGGTGGVVGQNTSSIVTGIRIKNLYIEMTNSSGYNLGGVVGVNYDGTASWIELRDSTIKGKYNVGGIVGRSGYENSYSGTISDVVVNANIEAIGYAGGLAGYTSTYYGWRSPTSGYIEGGKVKAAYNAGKAIGKGLHDNVIYASNLVELEGYSSGSDNGNTLDVTKQYISALDDILDTYYAGSTNRYFFDFESEISEKIVMYKTSDYSFTTQIRGSGTELDPYILITEQDFKDAALLSKSDYYFKIGDNIDISTFHHFYQLGTYSNFFAGYLDGNNKTITNMNIEGGRYSGLIGNQTSGSIKNLTITNSSIVNRYGGDARTGILVGNQLNVPVTNITVDTVNVRGSQRTGGLIGCRTNGTIRDIVTNNITVSTYYESSQNSGTGGIIGYHESGTLYGTKAINTNVTGYYYVGGLVGQNKNSTVNYAEIRGGLISGRQYIGGIAGESGYENTYSGTIANVVTNINVKSTGSYAGMIAGTTSTYYGWRSPTSGFVEGGEIDAAYDGGKALGRGEHDNAIYVSSTVEAKTASNRYNGLSIDITRQYIGAIDDSIDTVYGGTSADYYFDFESANSEKIILIKKNDHSFDITLSGSGTENDPYLISSESDFKQAAYIANQAKYFKLANNVDISTFNHFFQLGTTNTGFSGIFDGNNKTISNVMLEGGQYSGLAGNLNGGTIKNLNINNMTLTNKYGSEGRTGIIAGNLSNGLIQEINLNTINVSIGKYTGGAVGYIDGGTVKGLNINNATITGNTDRSSNYRTGGVAGENLGNIIAINFQGNITGDYYVGGIVGYNSNAAIIKEVTVRGNISGYSRVGGVAGQNSFGSSGYGRYTGYIYNALVNANITGTDYVAGLQGNGSAWQWETPAYGIVASGIITGGANSGTATGYREFGGLALASDAVDFTGSGGVNGTVYSSLNDNLDYYKTIIFDTNKPLLETSSTGDINDTGYWFDYDSNGNIIVVKIGYVAPTPRQPVCEDNCTNPDTYPLDTISTSTGTCPEGVNDNTPPTCTFEYFVAVNNGIRAKFSCTDDTSVPTIASMFNATTKEAYTYDMIIDEERGGTVKTGIVSGNTRSVTSTWTTAYSGPKPQRGLCYYYQLAARDQCGNESNYVTTYCYYGFSNNVTVTGP